MNNFKQPLLTRSIDRSARLGLSAARSSSCPPDSSEDSHSDRHIPLRRHTSRNYLLVTRIQTVSLAHGHEYISVLCQTDRKVPHSHTDAGSSKFSQSHGEKRLPCTRADAYPIHTDRMCPIHTDRNDICSHGQKRPLFTRAEKSFIHKDRNIPYLNGQNLPFSY